MLTLAALWKGHAMDKRTKAGRERFERLSKQAVLDNMPKVYFVEDGNRYRVGRTDWPSDAFNLVHVDDFTTFRKVYEALNMPLIDLTYDE